MMALRVSMAAVLLCALVSWLPAADLTEPLKTLQTVGPMGLDNQGAVKAWNAVSQAAGGDLPQLLAALDHSTPIGANYLRSAIEAIADRHAREGKAPPADALLGFLRDTSHSPRARRLAFELLTRFDAAAPDRLVPTFLNDPSTELRRDAVQRLIDQGAKFLGNAKQDVSARQQATTILRQAFDGARDLDQIESLTKDLKTLGHEVDLPRHFGFITQWKLIGPFDNTGESAFDVAYPPEKELNFQASYMGKGGKPVQWIDHTSADPHGKVDFNKTLGKANGVVAYAATEFNASGAQSVEFRAACICAYKLWVNGQLVDARNVYHSGSKIDQYIGRGALRPGRNTILVKVLQNEQTENWAQDWEFQLRVCDSTGTAVLSQDKLARP